MDSAVYREVAIAVVLIDGCYTEGGLVEITGDLAQTFGAG